MAATYPGTVTVDDLASALGVDGDSDPEDQDTADRVERAFNAAKALVDDKFDQAFKPVPEDVVDEVYIEVGMEMFKRTDAPGGGSQYVDITNGQQVRGPRDPLNRSYPIIRQYVLPF